LQAEPAADFNPGQHQNPFAGTAARSGDRSWAALSSIHKLA
jgi:hypothetical protein